MLRVAFLSDSHLAGEPRATDVSPDEMLARAVDQVATHGPDLVVLPGDISDDGAHVAYDRVRDTVARLGVPVLATPGNHDLAAPLHEVLGGAVEHHSGGWRVVCVDSQVEGEIHGAVDPADVAATLGPDKGTPTVLVLHHPPITLSTHPWFQLGGASDLLQLLAGRNDVRLVVTGHLHAAFELRVGEVTFLGCPSTWYAIRHHRDTYAKVDELVGGLLVDLGPDGDVDWRFVDTRSV